MSSVSALAPAEYAEAADPVPARPFFGRVESMRGLGAVAVAAYHFSSATVHYLTLLPDRAWPVGGPLQSVIGRLARDLIPGHAAVMMFFVISGFVLRVSLQFGPPAPGAAAGRFVIARIFRIYPIVVFDILLVCIMNDWRLPAPLIGPAAPLDVATFVENLLLLDVSINSSLWALQLEVLMVPLILALYFAERSFGPRLLLVAAVLATALSFTKQWALIPMLSHNLFAFAVGMLIPTVGRALVTELSTAAASRWLAVGTGLLMFAGPFVFGFYAQISAVIEAYAAALLLSLVSYRSDLAGARWLDRRALRRLGAASGSWYVLHLALMPAGAAIAALLFPFKWTVAAPLGVGLMTIVAWLVLIAPLMAISYRLIEAPGIALGHVVARLRPRRAAVQAA